MSISRVLYQRIFARQFRSSVPGLSGGGGGRPGGNLSVLSWKDKRILNERDSVVAETKKKSSPSQFRSTGSFEDLEKHFDLSKAISTDLSSLDFFQEPAELQIQVQQEIAAEQKSIEAAGKVKRRQKGPRSRVITAMLFGSHKSEGYMIPSKTAPVKVRFSHKRVFGGKKFAKNASE